MQCKEATKRGLSRTHKYGEGALEFLTPQCAKSGSGRQVAWPLGKLTRYKGLFNDDFGTADSLACKTADFAVTKGNYAIFGSMHSIVTAK